MASSSQESEQKKPEDELNKAEIERLRDLLESLDKRTEKGTCSLALSSISSQSLSFHASGITQPNKWILDSGATDHMTPFPIYSSPTSHVQAKKR